MTILTCECGEEIYVMNEESASAWQCDSCGQWYDYFGCKVAPPAAEPAGRFVQYSVDEE